jgi:biotin transport system substrate-specific component
VRTYHIAEQLIARESLLDSCALTQTDDSCRYTVGAAYASFMDTYVGSLSPGKYADFVVLSHDHVIESDAQSVLATYIGGLLVHNTSMVPSMKSSIKQGAKEALYWKAMVLRCVLGAIALAAAAQVCIYRPGNPVPITLQSLAVLALSVVLGSHLGMGAVLLYLLGGACGLPIFAGGSSGHHILLTEKSSGYLWGFLLAAWLAGHASGKDIMGLFWLSAASLTVLAVGGMRLAVIIGWRTAWQVGVAPFLLEALFKALLIKFGQVVYCYICGTSSQ